MIYRQSIVASLAIVLSACVPEDETTDNSETSSSGSSTTTLSSLLSPHHWNCTGVDSNSNAITFNQDYLTDGTGVTGSDTFTWQISSTNSFSVTYPATATSSAETFSITDIVFSTVTTSDDKFDAKDSRDNSALSCTKSPWSVTSLVETTAGNAVSPTLSSSANGTSFSTWHQKDGAKNNIWANKYDSTNGWGTAEKIETDNSGDAFNPIVVSNANGDAMAIWRQSDGTRDNIWSNKYTASTNSWGTAVQVESDTSDAQNAKIVMDNNGKATAVWERVNSAKGELWSSQYDGTNWGTPERIESNSSSTGIGIEIAIDNNSNVLVVWRDTATSDIWSNRYTSVSGWGTAENIEASSVAAGPPSLAMNTTGTAIATWHQGSSIIYNVYTSSGGWQGAKTLDVDNRGTGLFPKIAINSTGNAMAAWELDVASSTEVILKSSFYLGGSGIWLTADTIATDSSFAKIDQVLLNDSSEAFIAWRAGSKVNTSKYKFGDGLQPKKLSPIRGVNAAKYAYDSDGNVLSVWSLAENSIINIKSAKYNN